VPAQPTADDWARQLKSEWNARGNSPSRDYFVASHPGWSNPDAWQRQARLDAGFILHGLEDELAGAQLLEIGCGVGRLAPHLAARVGSYTGIDIAPAMVEEARRRSARLGHARFLESDGLTIPAGARDRSYDVVLALAVFIHCPRPVIGSLLASAWSVLSPRGEIRFQLRADPSDPTGISAPPAVAAQMAEEQRQSEAAAAPVDLSLVEGRYYMGDAFAYAEARELVRVHAPGEMTLLRFDPAHIYGRVRRS
jgi:SAM-dependent methyltransferase